MQTSWSYQATLHTNDIYRKGQKLTVAYTWVVFIASKYYYVLLIHDFDEPPGRLISSRWQRTHILSCVKRFTCIILYVDLGIKIDVWILVLLNLC
jgi:hypothetical protein